MSVSQESYYITNSELDNVLEEIGPLDWEDVHELGETMQTQDTIDSIFADITDPMIALRKLLEYTIAKLCLTSTDLIRNLAIMKKFSSAYAIWCHHSSSLKDQPVLLPQLLRYINDVSIDDLPFPGLQLDISKEELYRSDYQISPNRTKIVIWDYWLKQRYKTSEKKVNWEEVITAVDNSGHKELAVKMWKYNIYCYVLSRLLCTVPDDFIHDGYVNDCKSTYKKPTLDDLLVELSNIDLDFFLLGVGLKVPVDVLNQIEQECEGNLDTKYKQKVCEYWLEHCPEDTWGEVIATLMRTRYNNRELMWKQTDYQFEESKLMIEDMMFLLPSNLDIYLLGTLFKVTSSVLDKIDCKDMEKSRLDFFQDLLSTNPSLTWTKFGDMLIKMKRADLFLTLKNKYGVKMNIVSTQASQDVQNEEGRIGWKKRQRRIKIYAKNKDQETGEEPKTKKRKMLELENNNTDIPKLRKTINKVLMKYHAPLFDSSRNCLDALANEMLSAGLINTEVQRSPSFDGIISEFKSAMGYIQRRSELEEHCVNFLSVLTKLGGSFTRAAKALKEDWIEVGRTECGLELELNI